MASSSSISFHFRRTPRTWTGNPYERQEHSRAVWANSQLLFWFDCLHNKNIKTLRICPHCLAVSLAFVHYFVWVRGVRWKWNEIELDFAKYDPFYLKKHMRWTRRSLSSTINSNCTKLILKKIVLTQVLIWKGHFFFVFLPSNKFFLTCLTIIFHSCAYYFCVLFMKRVNTTICVMGRTQVKRTLWTPSNLTFRNLN